MPYTTFDVTFYTADFILDNYAKGNTSVMDPNPENAFLVGIFYPNRKKFRGANRLNTTLIIVFSFILYLIVA